MLTTLMFLVFAVFLLRRSYTLLLALLPVHTTEVPRPVQGLLAVILNVIALGLWFLAGLVALTSGVTDIVTRAIFVLQ